MSRARRGYALAALTGAGSDAAMGAVSVAGSAGRSFSAVRSEQSMGERYSSVMVGSTARSTTDESAERPRVDDAATLALTHAVTESSVDAAIASSFSSCGVHGDASDSSCVPAA
eukprot:Amastigsp_a845619_30.p3 type:complete len:114 gc:universal Amastigsp_a845619_30:581-922(+)